MARPVIIAAMAANRVIGNSETNDIPWNEPDDMAWFRGKTIGNTVVMGHRTFMSMHGIPLTNRSNYVMSRNPAYIYGVGRFNSLDDMKNELRWDSGPAYIIGGRQLYEMMIPHVNYMYLTHFDFEAEGDVLFPDFDPNEWIVTTIQTLEHGCIKQYQRANFLDDDADGWEPDNDDFEDDDEDEYEDDF